LSTAEQARAARGVRQRTASPAPSEAAEGSRSAPWEVRTALLAALFVLFCLCALYLARDIAVPITFAFVLSLLLQPATRWLDRQGIPRPVAALATISLFATALLVFGVMLSGPISGWVARAPESLPRLEKSLWAIEQPLGILQQAIRELERITDGVTSDAQSVSLKGPGIGGFLFSSTRAFAINLGTTVILLYFLLTSGELFLRRLVEILPTLSDKKQLVEISHEIERNISGYLVAITFINACVGITTGLATYLCGLSDPVLWGAIAFMLNYVLIVGPITNLCILVLAGLLTFDATWRALLPGLAYLAIHVAEGHAFTPAFMARRLTLNPVLIILSLIFWFWMWGIAGAFLAVPMLAVLKIVCDRIEPLMAIGHFLGGEAPPIAISPSSPTPATSHIERSL
jgi:predicted PurR-regulated permease PerM